MSDPGAQKRKKDSVIDDNLRRVYEQTVEEGVPDRFQKLLEALKNQEKSLDDNQ